MLNRRGPVSGAAATEKSANRAPRVKRPRIGTYGASDMILLLRSFRRALQCVLPGGTTHAMRFNTIPWGPDGFVRGTPNAVMVGTDHGERAAGEPAGSLRRREPVGASR